MSSSGQRLFADAPATHIEPTVSRWSVAAFVVVSLSVLVAVVIIVSASQQALSPAERSAFTSQVGRDVDADAGS